MEKNSFKNGTSSSSDEMITTDYYLNQCCLLSELIILNGLQMDHTLSNRVSKVAYRKNKRIYMRILPKHAIKTSNTPKSRNV